MEDFFEREEIISTIGNKEYAEHEAEFMSFESYRQI